MPPLVFRPASLVPTRQELVTMALDRGDKRAPDPWIVLDDTQPSGGQMSPIILENPRRAFARDVTAWRFCRRL